MPLIPELRRQRQADVYEFETTLSYIVSFRPGGEKVRPHLTTITTTTNNNDDISTNNDYYTNIRFLRVTVSIYV